MGSGLVVVGGVTTGGSEVMGWELEGSTAADAEGEEPPGEDALAPGAEDIVVASGRGKGR